VTSWTFQLWAFSVWNLLTSTIDHTAWLSSWWESCRWRDSFTALSTGHLLMRKILVCSLWTNWAGEVHHLALALVVTDWFTSIATHLVLNLRTRCLDSVL
jgi:hypothetical protein